MERELLKFTKEMNGKRNFPLMSKRVKRKNSTHIQNDIENLINLSIVNLFFFKISVNNKNIKVLILLRNIKIVR